MCNFKNRLTIVLAIVLSTVLMSSCQSDEELNVDANLISEDVMNKFTELGFDVSDLYVGDFDNPLTGEIERRYVLEGDIAISAKQMEEMLASDIAKEGPNGEQYRTNNLVSQGRTIRVIGYTGNNANGLDSKMQTALQWAVNNFNRLNINLNFTLTFGTNYQSYDMVVYRVSSSGGGGSAGFPSNGLPNKFIKINSGTSSYDTNVVEHVITHEMGHSVGLRHTDYFNRAYSCGSGGNEGDGGVGAVHIPGTPTGIDPNSIMLACFGAGEDGEFGQYDVTALEYLY